MDLVDLTVDLSDRADRVGAVYRALLGAVRNGRLAPGDRLPPSRVLAADLGVARGTVSLAYERLVAEGFADSRVGAGTWVTDLAVASPAAATASALGPRTGWRHAASPVSGQAAVPPYDFRAGIPDAGLFPFDAWRRLLAAELREGAHQPGSYGDPAGHRPLREAVARHLAVARGVAADPDHVVVTHGTQQALDLLARVLVTPGDVVAVEDPGYPLARELFASHGAEVVPVPVDVDGLVVDALPARAALVFTTPSHQFPLGPVLSHERRRALLAWATRAGAAVVEDDYDSEFRFTARPLETLHALDTTGRVAYVGTFSKSLLPALRAGYVVAPAGLAGPLAAARQLADGFGGTAEQAALARFVADGRLARHLRQARTTYAERRALVLDGLAALDDHLEVVPSAAGLHVTALLRDPERSDTAVVEAAAAHGVAVEALSSYAVADRRPGLVLGYGATRTTSVTPGLQRLRQALDATAPTPARRGR